MMENSLSGNGSAPMKIGPFPILTPRRNTSVRQSAGFVDLEFRDITGSLCSLLSTFGEHGTRWLWAAKLFHKLGIVSSIGGQRQKRSFINVKYESGALEDGMLSRSCSGWFSTKVMI